MGENKICPRALPLELHAANDGITESIDYVYDVYNRLVKSTVDGDRWFAERAREVVWGAMSLFNHKRRLSLSISLIGVVLCGVIVLVILKLTTHSVRWIEYSNELSREFLEQNKIVVVLMYPTWDPFSKVVKNHDLDTRFARQVFSKSNIVPLIFKYPCWGNQTDLGKKYNLNPRGPAVLVFSQKNSDSPEIIYRPSDAKIKQAILNVSVNGSTR